MQIDSPLPDRFGYRFPAGKPKALVMSYDDGSEHDRRLLALFNRYGIRGSFYLNSGKLDAPHHVLSHEVRDLYRGHEVACHTVNHLDLTQLDDDEISREAAIPGLKNSYLILAS